MRTILMGALLGLALTGAAFAQTNPLNRPFPAAITVVQEETGYSFRDDQGRALYFFDRDTAGRSHCDGQCAAMWPPVVAPADARPTGDWTPVRRSDGALQWAYLGKPVYRFAHDVDAGTRNGRAAPDWRQAAP